MCVISRENLSLDELLISNIKLNATSCSMYVAKWEVELKFHFSSAALTAINSPMLFVN